MEEEKTFLAVQMPASLKRQATIAAAKQGISRSEFVRRAVKEYIERQETEEKKA